MRKRITLADVNDRLAMANARKASYAEQRIHLTISAADSIPLTLLLAGRAEP